MASYVAYGDHEENRHHSPHSRRQRRVDPRRSLDTLQIQEGEYCSKDQRPTPVRDSRGKHKGLLAAPDNANHGVENVIHHHAPTRDVAERGIDLLSNVGEGRPGAGIGPRHAAIAESGEQHGHHGNEKRSDDVPVAAVAEYTEHRHRRDGLDHNYAIKDEIPERECAAEPGRGGGRRGSVFHGSGY
jgi:hypothetical protein